MTNLDTAQRNKIYVGHVLDRLRDLPEGCVQTVCTSPPYYGLRDYHTEPQIWDGDPACSHVWGQAQRTPWANEVPGPNGRVKNPQASHARPKETGPFCQRCAAWRGSLGLEPTADLYVSHLVQIFREIRRVLRKDGTVWLNLGDSYAGSWGNYAPGGIKGVQRPRTEGGQRWGRRAYEDTTFLPPPARPSASGLKEKDLIGIPWRVALALQADGWWLRSDIIEEVELYCPCGCGYILEERIWRYDQDREILWEKSNCMPSSVTDRPTTSHEHVFLLSRSPRYYYDARAIAEPTLKGASGSFFTRGKTAHHASQGNSTYTYQPTRNRRSVWTIPTVAYPREHYATWPPKLVEIMILAGSAPQACERCGSPWKRIVAKGDPPPEPAHREPSKRLEVGQAGNVGEGNMGFRASRLSGEEIAQWKSEHPDVTVGFQPTCRCPNTEGTGRCVILDPFIGSGTTAYVAEILGRDWVGIDLKDEYDELARARLSEIQPRLWTEEAI